MWKIAVAGAFAVALSVAALAAIMVLPGSDEPSEPPRAAIVDQLSLTFPNPDFVEQVTDTLEQAGYIVDYYPGEMVTVDFYRQLPTHGYDYILLRSHTAQFDKEWRGRSYDEAVLFTSEPYSPERYVPEQWELQINQAFTFEGAPRYFSIAANFIESGMEGDFGDATVIMMGCGGLQTDRTANAFVNKGAGTVIGWDDLVSARHTDAATEFLLEKLLVDELTPEAAVAHTMAEIGPDPAYFSNLLLHDEEG